MPLPSQKIPPFTSFFFSPSPDNQCVRPQMPPLLTSCAHDWFRWRVWRLQRTKPLFKRRLLSSIAVVFCGLLIRDDVELPSIATTGDGGRIPPLRCHPRHMIPPLIPVLFHLTEAIIPNPTTTPEGIPSPLRYYCCTPLLIVPQ